MPSPPGSADQRFTPPIAAVLFFAVAVMVIGQSCLFTILPPIGRQIGLSEFQIGLVMSIHGVFMMAAGPWWGAFSETAGRRRVIVIGAVLYTLSILMFGLVIDAALQAAISGAAAMWLLIGSRSVFAVGAGAVTPASMALAADLSTRDGRLRAMSLLAAAVSTGAILGPAASAVFAGLGLAVPFYVIAALGLAALAAARTMLPPVRPHMPATSSSFRTILHGRVLAISIASWCFMCGNYGIFSIFGFHVQDRFALDAVSAARYMGLGLMGAAAVNVVMQTLVIRHLRWPAAALVALGTPLTIASFAWAWAAASPGAFVVALTLNGLGQSFVNPAVSATLSLSVDVSGQGRLAGLSTSTQALAFLIAPVSAAAMYAHDPALPFMIGSIMTIFTIWIMATAPRQAKTDHE
jgi:MFS family permease